MVYNIERLNHALQVLRKASRQKRQHAPCRNDYANRKLRNTTRRLRTTNLQRWNSTHLQDDSSEDEYRPSQDRRGANAAQKKRKHTSKRKTADIGDESRTSKKPRERNPKENDNSAGYITLNITSQKGKAVLAELSQAFGTGLNSFANDYIDNVEPSYWRGIEEGSSSEKQRPYHWSDFNSITNTSHEGNGFDTNNSVTFKRTELRNGKIIEKKIEKAAGLPEARSIRDTSEQALDANKNSQVDVRPHQSQESDDGLSLEHYTTTSTGAKAASTSRQDYERHDDARMRSRRQSNDVDTHIHQRAPLAPISSPINRTSTLRPQMNPSTARNQARVHLYETSYAHPIDFRFIPNGDIQQETCDFCADWTMGLIGHGSRRIWVTIDPDNTGKIQEIRGGHRAEGLPPTKMCVECSLGRLLIMRCHFAARSSDNKEDLPAAFSRLYKRKLTTKDLESYIEHLFPLKHDRPDLVGLKKGPFPSCSLCVFPATWKCCQWQETDIVNRPCSIPKVNNSWLSTGLSSASKQTAAPDRTQKSTPIVISLLDSDDEEEQPTRVDPPVSSQTSRPSTTMKYEAPSRNLQPTPYISASPTPSSNFPYSRSLPPSPSHNPAQPQHPPILQPPLSGCGMYLCDACHTSIKAAHNDDDDTISFQSVRQFLVKNRRTKRADLEWLFSGSLLQKAMNQR